MSAFDNEYDVLVKILLLGDAGVGKTTFCNKLNTGDFTLNYNSTIGVDFFTKYVDIGCKTFKLQIWDTAGQERFKSIVTSYYRNTSLAIIMIDLNNQNSIKSINKWLTDINNYCKKDVKIIIIGNKKDLSILVNKVEIENIISENNIPYIEISVKNEYDFKGVMEIIHNKVCDMPMNYFEFQNVNLNDDKNIKNNKSKKCCVIS